DDGAGDAAGALRRDIWQRFAPRPLARGGKGERHRRIEMRAGNRRKDGDENDQDRAGRYGVAQQRDGFVAAGKPLRHDAGADDGGDENCGAQPLGNKAAADHAAESFDVPIESSWRCKVSLSSERSGRLTKILMRFVSIRSASANAKRTSASVPEASAGSGTPQ